MVRFVFGLFILVPDVSRRKFHGHSSLKEYYEKESCVHYIHNVSVRHNSFTVKSVYFDQDCC